MSLRLGKLSYRRSRCGCGSKRYNFSPRIMLYFVTVITINFTVSTLTSFKINILNERQYRSECIGLLAILATQKHTGQRLPKLCYFMKKCCLCPF